MQPTATQNTMARASMRRFAAIRVPGDPIQWCPRLILGGYILGTPRNWVPRHAWCHLEREPEFPLRAGARTTYVWRGHAAGSRAAPAGATRVRLPGRLRR